LLGFLWNNRNARCSFELASAPWETIIETC
jgi:hypothetical protein